MNPVFEINTFTAPLEVAKATCARPSALLANGVDLEAAVALARRCGR